MSFAFIRKRSKNYIVYLEYKDENSGKKIQKNMGSFEKKRDASRKLNELKDSIFNDELVLPNAVNLENFLIDFLDKHKINLSITTYNCYLRICKKYIIPMLGKYKLEELKPIHLQNYVDDLVGILAPQTLKIHINILNLALKKAYRLRLIRENIVECIELPKVKKFKNNIYNKTDMVKLLQVCKGSSLELQIYLASGLGLRISEVLGLTWDNIDFIENTITINKITVRDNNTVILKSPKTESSIREVAIPDFIVSLLEEYKLWYEEQKSIVDSDRLFVQVDGKPITPSTISKWFEKFIKQIGLPVITFHGLRHTNATLLIAQQVDVSTVSARLGHAQITTTYNFYVHPLKSHDKHAGNVLENLLVTNAH